MPLLEHLWTLDRNDIEAYVRNARAQAVHHALTTPFYQHKYATTEHPEHNFFALPLLRTSELSAYSPPYSDRMLGTTGTAGPTLRSGGSTGRRKTITHSWEFHDHVVQLGIRAITTSPAPAPESIANCFSAGDLLGGFFFVQDIAQQLRTQYFPVGTACHLEEIIDIIQSFAIDCLMATPSFIEQLAAHPGAQHALPHIRSIYYLGECFPDALRRRLAKYYPDIYVGSLSYALTETGPIAYQCSHDSHVHHINEDSAFVEIISPHTLQPATCGEEGDIVVTTLYPSQMPIIRFLTGDRGLIRRTPCSCGHSTLQLVVQGRTSHSVKICSTLIDKEHVLNLARCVEPTIREEDIQLAQVGDHALQVIQLIFNQERVSDTALQSITSTILHDYNFAHIHAFPGVQKVQFTTSPRSQFYRSTSGKTPFFIDLRRDKT